MCRFGRLGIQTGIWRIRLAVIRSRSMKYAMYLIQPAVVQRPLIAIVSAAFFSGAGGEEQHGEPLQMLHQSQLIARAPQKQESRLWRQPSLARGRLGRQCHLWRGSQIHFFGAIVRAAATIPKSRCTVPSEASRQDPYGDTHHQRPQKQACRPGECNSGRISGKEGALNRIKLDGVPAGRFLWRCCD